MNGRPEVDAVLVLARALERCSFFRIVVPSRMSNGRRLSVNSWVSRILWVALPLVGGATELRATGHWINKQRKLTTEVVRLLDFYVPKPFSRDVAVEFAVSLESIALQMRQEALAIAVEHRLHLLRPSPRQIAATDTPSRRLFIERVAIAVPVTPKSGRASRGFHA